YGEAVTPLLKRAAPYGEEKLRNDCPGDGSDYISYIRYAGEDSSRSDPRGQAHRVRPDECRPHRQCRSRALVSVYMHARRANCDLEIANPKQRILDLFSRSRLASVFEGHEELLGITPD